MINCLAFSSVLKLISSSRLSSKISFFSKLGTTKFFKGVGSVRNQLANKDFFVLVERIYDDIENLLGLGFEFMSGCLSHGKKGQLVSICGVSSSPYPRALSVAFFGSMIFEFFSKEFVGLVNLFRFFLGNITNFRVPSAETLSG